MSSAHARWSTSLVTVLAISLLAGLVSSAGSAPACAGNTDPETAAEAETEKVAPMDRDALYHRALKNGEALTSVWKQQPNNRGALHRYAVELRRDLSRLAEAASGEEAAAPPRPGAPREAGEAEASPPSGPVTTAAEPTPEEEKQKREEATLGKFLPTPPIGDPLATRTLAGSDDHEIRDACRRALEELARIDALLESNEAEPGALEAALAGLRAILFRMSEPPAEAPPVC